MKSESFLTLHRHHGSYHIQGPESYQEIDKIVHVVPLVLPSLRFSQGIGHL